MKDCDDLDIVINNKQKVVSDDDIIWKTRTKEDENFFKTLFEEKKINTNDKFSTSYVCKLSNCDKFNALSCNKTYNLHRYLLRHHKKWTIEFILQNNNQKKTANSESIMRYFNHRKGCKRKVTVNYLLSPEDFNHKIISILLNGVPLDFFNDDSIKYFLDSISEELNNCKINSKNI